MRPADFFVLRELSRRGGFVAAGDALAALKRWRDNYGAVQAAANGEWRLCYQPQWIGDARLHMTDAVVVHQTKSTNDDAAGLSPPVFVFAEHQMSGRGRRGRLWFSLPGAAVLFSAHLSMPPMAQGLTVAIGTGLWRVLKQYADVRLKWPNDLLDARGRKIGGVLAEAKGKSIIIGIGINLQLTPQMAALINKPAAGLADTADGLPPLAELSQMLAGAVRETCAKFAADGLRSFLPDALRAHLPQVGDEMTIANDAGAGEKNNSGIFAGFADDGALLLKSGGGIVRCLCGEVHNVAGG
ncbi:MAG: biotin--[acetyl-CoA-carboxylase] ligase, partial [Gammaproteobacteria bacterium]